jgi:dipeptidyl aminopeptidase/acylaminoacyl peptidase
MRRSVSSITGLSDGATTVQFALASRPTFFAAASVSTGFLERETILAYGGTGFSTFMKSTGYPDFTKSDPEFWKPYSVEANVDRISTPILMNIADAEEVMAVQDFAVLHDFQRPVEMIVYPDEFHNKWQPSHTKAIYERNLDWFDFWMRGKIDPALDKAPQYVRWRNLRASARYPSDAASDPQYSSSVKGGGHPFH